MLQIQFSGINLYSLILLLLCVAVCACLAWYAYSKSLPPVYPTQRPEPIGGGMVLIGIFLTIRFFAYSREIVIADIWMEEYWNLVAVNLEALDSKKYVAYLIIFATFLMLSIALVGIIFVLFLFFRKRDIFPRALTVFFIATEGLALMIVIISNILFETGETLTMTDYRTFISAWFFAGLAIWYVNTSERAKITFVLPHPSLVNYDDPEFLTSLDNDNDIQS